MSATAAAKGALTRERILQLAAPVFNRKGYAGASMADILAATGLQKGGIYNHFESKEQLAVEAFDYAAARMRQRWRQAMAGEAHAAARLEAVVSLFDAAARPASGGCPLMNTAIEADDNQPALRARARRAMGDLLADIGQTVTEGQASGQLRRTAGPEQVAATLVGTLEGALMLTRLYGDASYLRQAQEQMRRWIAAELDAGRQRNTGRQRGTGTVRHKGAAGAGL